ncbi:hypothetical protein J5N97_028200 [Dioscorea zingiberensis]|uniref:Uncharacterized protein n=1 Tax=Dioscorea zingiberensis TaxID=325984 RepID=A0A9D5H4L9_9LILI|nr:hypothetical protein J5N97_028200 [Dioscorea zingiberensis]
MEPPSSQIFYYNHTLQSSSSSSSWPPPPSSSSWQEDDRNLVYTTGKRPCHENMQNLSPYKIPSVSGSFVRAAHSPLLYRNMVSSSYQVDTEQKHAELHAHQSKKENCFLTLGNRAPSPMRSDIWSQNQERVEDDHDTSSYFGSSGPNACTPYYTFLPLATDVQKEKDIGDCEEAMSLDLNLKL